MNEYERNQLTKEQVNIENMNAVKKLLSGGSKDETQELQMIKEHSVKLNLNQIIGITGLTQINKKFMCPEIDEFLQEYMSLRMLTKESNKDILKGIEVKNNKALIEKTSIGLKVSG